MPKSEPADLVRVTLQVLWIGTLIFATFWIMRPLLPALIWAAMIAAATWPLLLKVEKWFGGRRGAAVAIMTAFMLLLFIVPFTLAITTIYDNVDRMIAWINELRTAGLPPLPEWAARIPVLGPKLAHSWAAMAGPEGLSERLAPYAKVILTWFLSQAGGAGMIAVQFLLTVIIAAILYSKGEAASRGVLLFARKLGGEQGEAVAVLAARTVRGVAIGVVGTAVIQSVIGGIGLAVAGVPAVPVLTAIMFMLCIAQIGPVLIYVPAVIWLYYSGQILWGTVLLIWAVPTLTIDNIIRPILIKRGASLPLLLVFAGVIGGLVTFGIAGLFIGPVVLAVAYTLLAAWVNSGMEA